MPMWSTILATIDTCAPTIYIIPDANKHIYEHIYVYIYIQYMSCMSYVGPIDLSPLSVHALRRALEFEARGPHGSAARRCAALPAAESYRIPSEAPWGWPSTVELTMV